MDTSQRTDLLRNWECSLSPASTRIRLYFAYGGSTAVLAGVKMSLDLLSDSPSRICEPSYWHNTGHDLDILWTDWITGLHGLTGKHDFIPWDREWVFHKVVLYRALGRRRLFR